jgi:GDP-4-dehydro-6-deoxy-D-mannose reductase
MRCLITGITGFAAAHLSQRLLAGGNDVFGTTHQVPACGKEAWPGARHVPLPPDRVAVVALDDAAGLTEIIRRVQPDGLFHLAALSSVPASFAAAEETYRVNLLGSLKVFGAVRDAAAQCRVVWVGSSDAYGLVEDAELPITETNAFRPLSPYAVSKAAADLAAYQWSRVHGLDVVRLRPFSHTGPGQAAHFVCSDFARQIAEVECGRRSRLDAGNLDVVRDFTDVRDVVNAYVLAWERGGSGEAYNVCSGTARTPRQILGDLMRLSGAYAPLSVQPARQRTVDAPVLVGSAAKLRRATNWSPAINWEDTLRDLLDEWRARLSTRP